MKKSFILLSSLLVLNSFAQNKPDCEKMFTDFETYYKEGFNEKAILTEEGRQKTLSLIQNITKECPSQNKSTYVFAEQMLLQIIKPMNMGEKRQEWTQYLTELYDKSGQYFPETRKQNSLKKVITLYNNGVYSSEETFKALDGLYTSDKDSFSAEALLIYTDFVASKSLNSKNLSAKDIAKIDELSITIATKIGELEKEKETTKEQQKAQTINTDLTSLKIASRNISSGLKVAKIDCETWNKVYTEEFDKNKSNSLWLKNALERLESYKCSANNDFFNKVAQQYYNIEKNSTSAYYLGNIAQQQKDYKKAQTYFNESAELETEKTKRAQVYYRIADLYRGRDKAQTKLFLEKAINNNPEMIEAYILLAKLYSEAEKDCFKNDFDYQARNFLAAQTINQVIKINPKYKGTAQPLSESYLAKAPSREEVKKAKMQGKTIQVGCWINQSILVP